MRMNAKRIGIDLVLGLGMRGIITYRIYSPGEADHFPGCFMQLKSQLLQIPTMAREYLTGTPRLAPNRDANNP
jgi:hypothetical protein